MNHGPLIFLGAFLSMALSWFGMIAMPQIQIGRQEQVIIQPSNDRYPTDNPGLAEQGRAIYVANGCQYCHTRSIQAGITFNVVLADSGTNQNKARLIATLRNSDPEFTTTTASTIVDTAPQYVKRHLSKADADALADKLRVDGAKVDVALEYTGTDVRIGWGNRFSVAQDYLYDRPALVGQLRLGPDLSTVGARDKYVPWHLIHLYDPGTGSPGSQMPALHFLFEKRPLGSQPSPDSLKLPVSQIGVGVEIVPKPEAIALAHYLVSLRAYPPLAEAPGATPPPVPRQLTAALATNQAAAVAAMEQSLTNLSAAVTAARQALLTASFLAPANEADLRTKTEALGSAELALAIARADQFGRIQASADRLTSVQISALAQQGLRGGAPAGRGGGGGGGGRGAGGGGPPRGGAAPDPGAAAPANAPGGGAQ